MWLDLASAIYQEHQPQSRMTLKQAANTLGIVPISNEYLDEHKRRELVRHPGNPLLKYAAHFELVFNFSLLLLCCIGLICAICTIMMVTSATWPHVYMMSATSMGSFAAVIFIDYKAQHFTMKGPSYWSEATGLTTSVPEAIASLAWEIHALVPRATFVIGTLYQSEIDLDPYLVMVLNDERLVLGIWDGKKIIRIATH